MVAVPPIADVATLRREAIEAARAFLAIEPATHVQQPLPTPTIAPWRHVLRAAIRAHKATGYTPAALACAARSEAESAGSDNDDAKHERNTFVGHLVRGELRIWQRVEQWLDSQPELEAAPLTTSTRVKRRRTNHQ